MTQYPVKTSGDRTSFVFYDLETTGISPEFDQALQFAAVRTDQNLNEVDSFHLRCQLAPHIVPSPGALFVNRVNPSMLTDPSLPSHYEALRAVRAKFVEWSPAIFIGYNSISFDEDFLRQGFYQTLQPVYLTNTTGNARGDMMRVAHAATIYAPGALNIPTNGTAGPVYKLDQLAPANGYSAGNAHEAMADVAATLFLARLIRKRAATIWNAMSRWTSKQSVIDFLRQQDVVWYSGVFAGRPYAWRVTCCGQNSERDSQLAVFDLQYDPQVLLGLSVEGLIKILNASPKKIRSIAANRHPILMPNSIVPTGATTAKTTAQEIQRRIALIRKKAEFEERVSKALARRYGVGGSPEFVEQRIYDGFPTRADEEVMEKFQCIAWEERVGLLETVQDKRSRELGLRLVYLEHPEALPRSLKTKLDAWRKEKILTKDPNVPWMTVPKALLEVDRLMTDTSDSNDREFLKDLKRYITDLSGREPA